jgi:hypothetical protein
MGCPALLFSGRERQVRHPLRRNSCARRKKEAEASVIFERLNGMGGKDVNNSRDARNIVNSYSRRGSSYITMSICRPCCLHPLMFQLSDVLLSTLQLSMFSLLLTSLLWLVALMLLPLMLLMASLLLLEFPSFLVLPLLLASLPLIASCC